MLNNSRMYSYWFQFSRFNLLCARLRRRFVCQWAVWLAVCALLTACTGRGPRRVPGQTAHYLPLSEVARQYDLDWTQDTDTRGTLAGPRWTAEWQADSRRAQINGVTVWLHQPVVQYRCRLMLAVIDRDLVLDPLLRSGPHLAQVGGRRVIIDPGHGGSDPGARGASGVTEKELVLRLSHKVAARLTAAGVTVQLTRKGDEALTLSERLARAQTAGGDLFVSLHLNAAGNPEARGIETFVLPAADQPGTAEPGHASAPGALPGNRFDAANQALGFLIHQQLIQATGTTDRGLRRARFFLLREAPCPAVLVEAGFLTHAGEEQQWLQRAYRQRVADAIAKGILAYLEAVEQAQR